MITNEERREVARRLREIDIDSIGHGYELLEEVASRIGCEGVKYGTSYGQFVVLLADLIDPGELKTTCVVEVKIEGEKLDEAVNRAIAEYTGIDRDALLVEVKELEKCAWYFGLDFDEDEPLRDRLEEASEAFAESACRIREALGVRDD